MNSNAIEAALVNNDLSKLTSDERLNYYNKVCDSLGLNSLTQPFAYITLNGKLTLYAKRDATEQLRKVHKVSITITDRQTINGVYVVTARATDSSGRIDESTGAVYIEVLKGEALANAFLKAETKAKRRVTLSICGLGVLDESEVESITETRRPIQGTISHVAKAADQGTVSRDIRPKETLEIIAKNESELSKKAALKEAMTTPLMAKDLVEKLKKYGKDEAKFYQWLSDNYDTRMLENLTVEEYMQVMEVVERKNDGKT